MLQRDFPWPYLADDNARAVIDAETLADDGARMDVDPRPGVRVLGQHPRQQRNVHPVKDMRNPTVR